MISIVLLSFVACINAQGWMHHPMLMAPPAYAPIWAPGPGVPSSVFEGKRIVVAQPGDQCSSGFKYEIPQPLRVRDERIAPARRTADAVGMDRSLRLQPILSQFLTPLMTPWFRDDPMDEDEDNIDDDDSLDETGLDSGEIDLDLDAADHGMRDAMDRASRRGRDDLEEGAKSAADCVPDFKQFLGQPGTPATAATTTATLNPWSGNRWGGMMMNPYMGYPFRYNMGAMGLPMPMGPMPIHPVMADNLMHSIVAPVTPLHPLFAPMPYIRKHK